MRKFVHRRDESLDKIKDFDPMDANERTIVFSKEVGQEHWEEGQNEETSNPDKTAVNNQGFKVKTSQNKISSINTQNKKSDESNSNSNPEKIESSNKIKLAQKTYDEQKKVKE